MSDRTWYGCAGKRTWLVHGWVQAGRGVQQTPRLQGTQGARHVYRSGGTVVSITGDMEGDVRLWDTMPNGREWPLGCRTSCDGPHEKRPGDVHPRLQKAQGVV